MCGRGSAPAWWTAPTTGVGSASRPTASSASAEMDGPGAAGPTQTVPVRPPRPFLRGLWSPPRPAGGAPSPAAALTLGPPSVNCGWSSWSPWTECLGPCGSRSIQWSFQSANNVCLAGPQLLHPPGTCGDLDLTSSSHLGSRLCSGCFHGHHGPQTRTPTLCAPISLNTRTPSASLGIPGLLLHQFYALEVQKRGAGGPQVQGRVWALWFAPCASGGTWGEACRSLWDRSTGTACFHTPRLGQLQFLGFGVGSG